MVTIIKCSGALMKCKRTQTNENKRYKTTKCVFLALHEMST